MPAQEAGELHGFQLWINLPARDKMKAPQYRDLSAQQLPWQSPAKGVRIKLIGGQLMLGTLSLHGPLLLPAQAVVADVELEPHQPMTIALLRPAQRLLFYPYRGALAAPERISRGQLGNWSGLTSLELHADGDGVGGLLLLGDPLNEPMAHYGPFVMNTVEELRQAVTDFQQGRLTRRPPQIFEDGGSHRV
jgi:redox-sensitive bicupin YhaK (pirin superfamily)